MNVSVVADMPRSAVMYARLGSGVCAWRQPTSVVPSCACFTKRHDGHHAPGQVAGRRGLAMPQNL